MSRKLSITIIVIIILVIAYNLIGQITSSLKAGDHLAASTDTLHQLQVQNQKLKQRLQEVESPQFVEEQARDKLGLARPGETVVVIPNEKIAQVLGASQSAVSVRVPNWLGWLRLFWH